MPSLKHIGRIHNNQKRAIVAYRTLPGDAESALVVLTESLPADAHDALVKLVESAAGQQAYELAEAMERTYLPDGMNMLYGFHKTGCLRKVATKEIEMLPDAKSSIKLDELNKMIAQQKGVSIEDLAIKSKNPANNVEKPVEQTINPVEQYTETTETSDVLTDDDLAAKYRSDADRLSKEAAALRRQAEELVPTKKKRTAKVEKSV